MGNESISRQNAPTRTVAIATLHDRFCEGAALQAYSLARLVERTLPGTRAEILDHRYPSHPAAGNTVESERHSSIRKAVDEWIPLSAQRFVSERRGPAFDYVRRNAAAMIVGSDEVWRFEFTSRYAGLLRTQQQGLCVPVPNLYWPDDSVQVPRISFAATIGSAEWHDMPFLVRRRLQRILNGFAAISVRDVRTLRFIEWLDRPLARRTALVPDPTWAVDLLSLVDADALKARLVEAGVDFSRPRCGFIAEPSESARLCAAEMRRRGYQIVGITTANDFSDVRLFDHGFHPLEWARLLGFMDCVVSEQMYGTIFCLQNRTPVVTLGSAAAAKEPDSTTLDLLLGFGLDRFWLPKGPATGAQLIAACNDALAEQWDWDRIAKQHARHRRTAEVFLERLKHLLPGHETAAPGTHRLRRPGHFPDKHPAVSAVPEVGSTGTLLEASAASAGKRVAIWGSYNYGNYGDDLMAIVFAKHVKRLGLTPIVFGLSPRVGASHGFEVTDDVSTLIRNAAACVIGGGAWLAGETPRAAEAARKRTLEFLELASAIERHACPTFLMSIGSDGPHAKSPGLSVPRQRLLRSGLCRLATVRLPGDRAILDAYGIPSRYFPDILLDAGRLLSVPPQQHPGDVARIGLNIGKGSRFAGAVACVLAAIRPDIEIHFIDTVCPSPGKVGHASDYEPPRWTTARAHVHNDPVDTLRYISGLDVIITHKLHLGVTALSLGVPYIALGGQGKCRAFLDTIGSPESYVALPRGRRECWRFFSDLLSRQGVRAARSQFDFGVIEDMQRQSHGHLETLNEVLVEFGASRPVSSPAPTT